MSSAAPVPAFALSVAAEVAPRVRLGIVAAAPIAVGPSGSALNEELRQGAARSVERWGGREPSAIEQLQPARELYRAFGIDPTKTRPSSESLLRRALKGQPLPLINGAVDVCNALSLGFLLPIGLYDARAIDGPVELRAGRPGESYPGIRKETVHLEGRPVLADRRGPFGNPTSDSLRTAVGESTTALWMVIFGPRSLPMPAMEAHVRTAREAIERHLGSERAPARTSGTVV